MSRLWFYLVLIITILLISHSLVFMYFGWFGNYDAGSLEPDNPNATHMFGLKNVPSCQPSALNATCGVDLGYMLVLFALPIIGIIATLTFFGLEGGVKSEEG